MDVIGNYCKLTKIQKKPNLLNCPFRFSHSYLRQWTKAANYAKKLVNESKWSRCVYTYMLAIYIAADETLDEKKKDETVIAIARLVSPRQITLF